MYFSNGEIVMNDSLIQVGNGVIGVKYFFVKKGDWLLLIVYVVV